MQTAVAASGYKFGVDRRTPKAFGATRENAGDTPASTTLRLMYRKRLMMEGLMVDC